MSLRADVAVVGLGAVGVAVALQLAKRGASVVGIDRFHPPHDRGSSHGRTRITRLAVGEGADYVPLVQRSHVLWREFESETGLALMRRTGVLLIASPGVDSALFHGQTGFAQRTRALARRFDIAHELLDAASIRERFPAFAPGDEGTGYFEPDGGVLFPEACLRAQWQLAERHGARLRPNEAMTDLVSTPFGATIVTERGQRIDAGHVVCCTGAWLPRQVGGEFRRRLRVLRQTLHWFEPETPAAFDAAACPAFIWLHGPSMEASFYGFPMVDGVPGVKVATEQLREACDPDTVQREVVGGEAASLYARHLRGRVTGLTPRSVLDAPCLYTMAADGRFIVDRHPAHEHVTVASACSGHGFKHSCALGETIAQRLLGEGEHPSLAAFRIARG